MFENGNFSLSFFSFPFPYWENFCLSAARGAAAPEAQNCCEWGGSALQEALQRRLQRVKKKIPANHMCTRCTGSLQRGLQRLKENFHTKAHVTRCRGRCSAPAARDEFLLIYQLECFRAQKGKFFFSFVQRRFLGASRANLPSYF